MPEDFERARGRSISGRLLGGDIRQYVLDRGGALTIATTTMPGGWWSTYTAPSGLTEEPQDTGEYVSVDCGAIRVFVSRQAWDVPRRQDDTLKFVIRHVGWFSLELDPENGS